MTTESNKVSLLMLIPLVVIANTGTVLQLVAIGTIAQEAIAEMIGELVFSVMLRLIFISDFSPISFAG